MTGKYKSEYRAKESVSSVPWQLRLVLPSFTDKDLSAKKTENGAQQQRADAMLGKEHHV